MSKIQEALAAATECEPSKRKNEAADGQDYMKRLTLQVAELSDADWNKLPIPAQDWYNKAADALKLGSEIPAYGDDEAAAPTRRGAAKPWAPAVGVTVAIVTKRGKNMVGKITELDDEGLVLDDGTELNHSSIANIGPADGVGAASQGVKEPELPTDPEVGFTVTVVTARGKEITGVVEVLEDDDLVVKDGHGESHELTKSKLKSLVVKSTGDAKSAAGKSEPAAKTTPKADAKPDDKKKITAKDNGGVSATQRMRELICADMTMAKPAIGELLKKENLEFKQATLDLIYSDSHKLIGILRDLKKIK